jgi:hypothetical protein
VHVLPLQVVHVLPDRAVYVLPHQVVYVLSHRVVILLLVEWSCSSLSRGYNLPHQNF